MTQEQHLCVPTQEYWTEQRSKCFNSTWYFYHWFVWIDGAAKIESEQEFNNRLEQIESAARRHVFKPRNPDAIFQYDALKKFPFKTITP